MRARTFFSPFDRIAKDASTSSFQLVGHFSGVTTGPQGLGGSGRHRIAAGVRGAQGASRKIQPHDFCVQMPSLL